MAFITIEDETGKIEAVTFPKTFSQYEEIIAENKAVYLEGKTNFREDEMSIIINSISATPPDTTNKYDFIIKIPPKTNQQKLMQIDKLLKSNPNGHRGLIILSNGKEVPLSYGVKYTQNLKQQINQILNID